MSLLQLLLFPEPLAPPVIAQVVSFATSEDIGEERPVPKKRIRGPRGGGKALSATGEPNVYFNELRQNFYVLLTYKGARRGKYGFRTAADAAIARDKFKQELRKGTA